VAVVELVNQQIQELVLQVVLVEELVVIHPAQVALLHNHHKFILV
jgi:hypothetical protein